MRTLFLDWFHPCFIPEVRKYTASKGLSHTVLLILGGVPDHPESCEFNAKGIKRVYLPPNTTSVTQFLIQGGGFGEGGSLGPLGLVTHEPYGKDCQHCGREPG